MSDIDLREHLETWEISLQARHLSPGTRGVYLSGVTQYLDWCAQNGRPEEVTKSGVTTWIAERLESEDWQPATAHARLAAMRVFAAWLADEDGIAIDTNPLQGMKPPKIDEAVVEPLSIEQLQALIAACAAKAGASTYERFVARRDEASVRFLAETGTRAGEFLAMTIPDTDLKEGVAIIRRGKGGKGRRVPFGPQTALAISRYLRYRSSHKLADTPTLWLGSRNRGLSYDGLRAALLKRAEAAEIPNFHLHMTRHTFASRWLDVDGSEGGAMAIAGWSRSDMLRRYTKATKEKRAADEARRLSLGDL